MNAHEEIFSRPLTLAEAVRSLLAIRRVTIGEFAEAGLYNAPTYLRGIQEGDFLPSSEKLELMISVFVEAARDQQVEDPEADGRFLTNAYERTRIAKILETDLVTAELLRRVKEVRTEGSAEDREALRELVEGSIAGTESAR